MGSHLKCHLEFLNLLNGDKMPSTGSININKIATKLFGHFRRKVLRFSLVLAAILDATFTVYILLHFFNVQLIQLLNTSDFRSKSLSKHDYFRGK